MAKAKKKVAAKSTKQVKKSVKKVTKRCAACRVLDNKLSILLLVLAILIFVLAATSM